MGEIHATNSERGEEFTLFSWRHHCDIFARTERVEGYLRDLEMDKSLLQCFIRFGTLVVLALIIYPVRGLRNSNFHELLRFSDSFIVNVPIINNQMVNC
jgi:hypothetical protein